MQLGIDSGFLPFKEKSKAPCRDIGMVGMDGDEKRREIRLNVNILQRGSIDRDNERRTFLGLGADES